MKFPAGIDLDRIALKPSKDETRPYLHQPYLDLRDATDPRIVACNGAVIAAVAVDLDGDDGVLGGPIPRDAMKAANGVSDKTGGSVLMATDVVRSEKAGITFDRPPETSPFPDWRGCMPRRTPTVHLSINAKMLHDLARSLGCDVLNLDLVSDGSGHVIDPIVVSTDYDLDVKAVIMPCRYTSGEHAEKDDAPLHEDAPLPFDGASAAGETVTLGGVEMPAPPTAAQLASAADAVLGETDHAKTKHERARRKGPKAGE